MNLIPGLPKDALVLLTRGVEALEAIAAELAEHNRNATIDRLGRTSRERIAADAALDGARANGVRAGACPVEPADADLAPAPWPGFGAPCGRDMGQRGTCAKSLGHSGRCKP